MTSDSWLIIEALGGLFILGLLSFVWSPSYEKGAWFVITAFWGVLNLILGAKYSRKMPEQAGDAKPGQSSTSETTTTTTAPAPTEPATPPVAAPTGNPPQA